ncbi:sigma-70 family RNA polymerase sigma factor [Pontibacter sp. G13]|uniref:sigma-70 family RNA polymerase sigma factor n=1 Tax=Pontibacter sp. G13 TaxID=3074898 RepID=UPI00288B2A43|nr:sigma-70 family RNA polymerase sigma factor [Pontibacter sp. G13]WNJ17475.1 sigma-70 family RNA polymerase sigma factor [Pontibacter sp. G13]
MSASIESLYLTLYQFVRKRVRNDADAQDLTQEVFLKLSKSDLGKVEDTRQWVFAIARNTITDYYRKRQISTEELVDESLRDSSAESSDAVRELGGCIKQFIQLLPESDRQLLIWADLEQVPQKEIAERLGINYVTLRSQIQRARKKLKDLFTSCCEITQGGRGSIMDYQARPLDRGEKFC